MSHRTSGVVAGGAMADAGQVAGSIPGAVTRRVIAICLFTILAEGYDVGIYGVVLPALIEEHAWGLSPLQMGVLGSYALFGMLLGAMLVGTISDIIGRKKILLACLGLFSITMALAAVASTAEQFALYRFIGGLGLGGLIPTASALTIEYSPVRRRSFNYAVMFSGYALGGVVVALLSLSLLGSHGWRILFMLGALPLFAVPFIALWLPESVDFLRSKQRHQEADALASRLGIVQGASNATPPVAQARSGVLAAVGLLFSRQNLRATLLFWVAYFMGLLLVYGLNTWLPQLMRKAGYPLGSSLALMLALNLTAVVGALIAGAAADRWGSQRVIVVSYLLAALSVGLLSLQPDVVLLYALVGVAGFGSISTTLIMSAYISKYFPANARATALGWALGFGRLGAIAGPVLGGFLLGSGTSLSICFYVFALAGVLAALAVFLIPARAEDQT
ncbi:MFS transporter [Vogesella sp. LIG4]|uniref:MFS transporter n=1 Tax=Vogesella sp. LIG4 TaxID=1192162 RepID=UPI00081FBCB6|nr:MFS transporter [Vogesella sp. LIG4]SCK20263.1 MFS transporter, AAHS family, benzoate transport protein [Vogesella sp. LIG4]